MIFKNLSFVSEGSLIFLRDVLGVGSCESLGNVFFEWLGCWLSGGSLILSVFIWVE